MKIIAITPCLLSLGCGECGENDFIALYIGMESVELAAYSDGIPYMLKHLCSLPAEEGRKSELAGAISREVENILMLLPEKGASGGPSEIILWDDRGLDGKEMEKLKASLPLPVKESVVSEAKRASMSGPVPIPSSAAVSLARAGAEIRNMPVNFIRSKIAVKKHFRWRRTAVRASGLTALGLIVLLAGILDLHKKEAAVKNMKEQIRLLGPELEEAGAAIEYTDFMLGWQGEKMKFLECLREITLAFPLEGKIWMTSMAVRDDMRILLSGKSSESRTVMELIDNIKMNPVFSDVNLVYLRNAGGDTREVVYAVNFIFAFREAGMTAISGGGN